jgi:hypothetical protein
MTQAVNIVLADAQATPVNHTFIPVGRDTKGVFWFEDQSQANSVGFWRISVETRRPAYAGNGTSAQNRTYRTVVGLHEPVLEVLSPGASGFTPAPTVAYIPRVFTEYVDPERSSLANRKDIRKMNATLQGDAQIIAVVETHSELSF